MARSGPSARREWVPCAPHGRATLIRPQWSAVGRRASKREPGGVRRRPPPRRPPLTRGAECQPQPPLISQPCQSQVSPVFHNAADTPTLLSKGCAAVSIARRGRRPHPRPCLPPLAACRAPCWCVRQTRGCAAGWRVAAAGPGECRARGGGERRVRTSAGRPTRHLCVRTVTLAASPPGTHCSSHPPTHLHTTLTVQSILGSVPASQHPVPPGTLERHHPSHQVPTPLRASAHASGFPRERGPSNARPPVWRVGQRALGADGEQANLRSSSRDPPCVPPTHPMHACSTHPTVPPDQDVKLNAR